MIKGEQSLISLIRNFLKLIPHTNSYTILLHKIALCPIVAAIYNTFFILTRIFPDRLFCDWFYFLANKSTLLGLDFFFFLHSKFLFWLSVSLLEINCRVLFCFVFFPLFCPQYYFPSLIQFFNFSFSSTSILQSTLSTLARLKS